jgi:glucose-6-phosphate dehydrogenase assembly protein OpcA
MTRMPLDTSLLGLPVELGQVGRELKKLWESTGGTKSRASLVNFAVRCEGTEALEANTRLISDFTREHACRAILLAQISDPTAPAVQTWINAHCHLARAGAKQVCCEQLTFLVNSASERLLSNVLLANLDSDLPLYLWWQGELREGMDEQLWPAVDRLIFDSREWRDLGEQVARLHQALAAATSRLILCDLNWTRTLHLRQAVAQIFDQPENLELLTGVRTVQLQHAPGHESTALLFAAWVSAQLGWEPGDRDAEGLSFTAAGGDKIRCQLRESDGAPIALFEIAADAGVLKIQRDAGSPFFRTEVQLGGRQTFCHLLPASDDGLINLLDEELMLGGRHRVYLKALGALGKMLETAAH